MEILRSERRRQLLDWIAGRVGYTERGCQWIIGDADGIATQYCREDHVESSSYCAEHRKRIIRVYDPAVVARMKKARAAR